MSKIKELKKFYLRKYYVLFSCAFLCLFFIVFLVIADNFSTVVSGNDAKNNMLCSWAECSSSFKISVKKVFIVLKLTERFFAVSFPKSLL